mgnify:FL=1|jgi:hypothetical protein
MEETINDFSGTLILWQTLHFLLLSVFIDFLVKMHKRLKAKNKN